MKHFTRQYVENYSTEDKTKEQLQRDVQICSLLLDQFTVTAKRKIKLNRLGAMAIVELFKRYGDYALWSAKYISELPDSAFALVGKDGTRRFPYLSKGKIPSLPYVRWALSSPDLQKETRERLNSILNGTFQEIIELKEYTFEKENYSETVAVHSVTAEMSMMNPKWLELTGILFHRGKHKGILYEDDVLKSAMLVPREGENLCYVNFYHKNEEGYRVGIMADVWWDPDIAWYCPTNDMKGKGALMYRSFVTDKQAISELMDKKIGNVSAELHFNTYIVESVNESGTSERIEKAVHVEISGKAITPMPALKAADIDKICTTDKDGKRSCESMRKSKLR